MIVDSIVKYTKQIYSYEMIKQAVEDYRGVCPIIVIDTPEEVICEFQMSKDADPTIVYEFTNYLVELMCSEQ